MTRENHHLLRDIKHHKKVDQKVEANPRIHLLTNHKLDQFILLIELRHKKIQLPESRQISEIVIENKIHTISKFKTSTLIFSMQKTLNLQYIKEPKT